MLEAGRGNCRGAVEHYERALSGAADDARSAAAADEASLRDTAEAVRLADVADEADADALDTLAAAYADAGRFGEAVATARRALSTVAGDPNLASQIRDRLALYEAGRAYRTEPAR